jgi:hypothetical protein
MFLPKMLRLTDVKRKGRDRGTQLCRRPGRYAGLCFLQIFRSYCFNFRKFSYFSSGCSVSQRSKETAA